jgi:hypothetical protein
MSTAPHGQLERQALDDADGVQAARVAELGKVVCRNARAWLHSAAGSRALPAQQRADSALSLPGRSADAQHAGMCTTIALQPLGDWRHVPAGGVGPASQLLQVGLVRQRLQQQLQG